MAFLIEFIKDDKVNNQVVKKGTKLKVSRSIRDAKVNGGIAKEATKSTPKKKDK